MVSVTSSGSSWPQVTLATAGSEVEATENALMLAGALSITYLDEHDDPVLEPAPGEMRLWDNLLLVALFEQGRAKEDVIACVCKELKLDGLNENAFSWVEDQAWERAWMDEYKPMQFGSKLWICPTHVEPPEPDAVNILLDPGLAFGTGTHATTALCLQWLDAADLDHKRVIDFGCGSGVLGVAALLLGADKVYATDIDPQAMQATGDNAKANHVIERLILQAATELEKHKADILVANILFQPLVDLKDFFAELLVGKGEIVMSGVLEDQVEQLRSHYESSFEIQSVKVLDGWARVYAIRRC